MIEDEDARIELFKEVVASNNKLLHELRLLIKECGFSDLSGDRAHRYKKVLEWYDSEAEEKRSEFFDKIHKLAESFDIPEDFLGTLLEFVVMGTINLPRNRGVSIVHRHGHRIGREIVIRPDATMSNLDMHIIRHFQRKTLLKKIPHKDRPTFQAAVVRIGNRFGCGPKGTQI